MPEYSKDNEKGYYYLHTNGDLIYKNAYVVDSDPEYFTSPFVRKFWCIRTDNRSDAWTVILEALALGCNVDRAKELINEWGLNKQDSFMMLNFLLPDELRKKGLNIFISEILCMKVSVYWQEVERLQLKNISIDIPMTNESIN